MAPAHSIMVCPIYAPSMATTRNAITPAGDHISLEPVRRYKVPTPTFAPASRYAVMATLCPPSLPTLLMAHWVRHLISLTEVELVAPPTSLTYLLTCLLTD